jgi:hypothetical protein
MPDASRMLAQGQYATPVAASSDLSFDTAKALELWNSSADMTHLPHDLVGNSATLRIVSA